jgi:hypothetical protein
MSESGRERIPENPRQYVCPSCRLHLLSWTTHTNTIEMFHKVALWSDFWTGDVLVLALGIHQVEARLLRWRPEYQSGG